jgi:hypothetical protein
LGHVPPSCSAFPFWNLKDWRAEKWEQQIKYYEAVFTDSGTCMIGCGHKHQNIVTATACISQPGAYVVGVNRRGKFWQLNDKEEVEFQSAMFGHGKRPDSKPPLGLNVHAKKI